MLRHVVVVVGELLDMLLLEMARPNWADLLEPAEEQVSAGTPIFQVQRQALAQPNVVAQGLLQCCSVGLVAVL